MGINVILFILGFKMATKQIDNLLLNDLSTYNEGILAISLFNKNNIPISDFLDFINRYSEKGIISVNKENKISLTTEGFQYVQSYNLKKSGALYFEMLKQPHGQVGINEPYIPNTNIINELKGRRNETSD